jgi:hypothetical protein
MLALDVVCPLVAVQVSLRAGLSPVLALSAAALFPLADATLGIARSRRVNIVAAVSLAAILTGLGLAFATHNALFAILKDSAFTLIFGALFLGSLATARPLVFRLYRETLDPKGVGRLESAWLERPAVRRTFRLMTLAWGLGLVCEAVVRAIVSFSVPLALAAALSPCIAFAFIGGLIVWTVLYAQARRRGATRAGFEVP